MIEPQDLLTLANRLATMSGEAEGRAAASRAYYGVFHMARLLIEEGCGVLLPSGPDVHRKLQFCLEQSQARNAIAIGLKLQTLREQRNRADYQLADSKFANPQNVKVQIERAKEIVAEFEAAAAQVASFRSAVRDYARDVLKLRLKSLSP